jgi:inosine-uridine nucleoside N-ribohydrolase
LYPDYFTKKKARLFARLGVEVINRSTDPVLVFINGTHTYLANTLRNVPVIKNNIAAINFMKDAQRMPGNIASNWLETPISTNPAIGG